MYVDDIIITDNDTTSIEVTKSYLHTQFHIKDLRNLKYYLGIKVTHYSKDIYLTQRKYTLEILEEMRILSIRVTDFPMVHLKLNLTAGPLLGDPSFYQHLIEKLLCLTITLSYIVYAVHILN